MQSTSYKMKKKSMPSADDQPAHHSLLSLLIKCVDWLTLGQPTGNFVGLLLCACSYDITSGTVKYVMLNSSILYSPYGASTCLSFTDRILGFIALCPLSEIRLLTQTHQIFMSLSTGRRFTATTRHLTSA